MLQITCLGTYEPKSNPTLVEKLTGSLEVASSFGGVSSRTCGSIFSGADASDATVSLR